MNIRYCWSTFTVQVEMNMQGDNRRVSYQEAKNIDLVEWLLDKGHKPVKIRGNDYWYLSPLRTEKTASFKVNCKKNVWYDHGIGKGGNIITFAVLYFNCPVTEALKKINNALSFEQPSQINTAEEEKHINIISQSPLKSLSLRRYFNERRIAVQVAEKYCVEVNFSLNNKVYHAIGFRNNAGGYELRNPWFKGSSAPKAITTLENGSTDAWIFEGFFDFLSFRTIHLNQPPPGDCLILNSTSFFEQAKSWMEGHRMNHLFLDNDGTGMKLTERALSWGGKYIDESKLYKGYKDLNEWVQHFGKGLNKRLKP